jgi:hypothetical protein
MANRERLRSSSAGSGDCEVIGDPCSCGREAAVEKRGRTVCRECADNLTGREFPLRRGTQRASFGSFTEREQLSMYESHSPMRFYGRYLG